MREGETNLSVAVEVPSPPENASSRAAISVKGGDLGGLKREPTVIA